MGNCRSDAGDGRCRKGGNRKVTLALFGLDNAGKTVTAKGFLGEEVDTPSPTIGFSSVDFRHGRYSVTMFDLGGGKNIRGIWKNYFAEIHGMIFVVDASAPARLDECKMTLTELLKDEMVRGKPVLLLANKQDIYGAMDEMEICDRLQLEDLVNVYRTPCRVESCSAAVRQKQKMDKTIRDGFCWLLELVDENWKELGERVKRDVARKEAKERQAKVERAERVHRSRELREKEQKANGHLKDEADEDEVDGGNPFKPIEHQLELSQNEMRKSQELKIRQHDAGGKTLSKSHPESDSLENGSRKPSTKSKHRLDHDDNTTVRSVRFNDRSDSEGNIADRPSTRSNRSTERTSIRSNHRLNVEGGVIQRSRSDFEEDRLSARSKRRLDDENYSLRPEATSHRRSDLDKETLEIHRRPTNWNQPLKAISPTRISRLKNGSDDSVTEEDDDGSGSVVLPRTSYSRIVTPPVPLLRAADIDRHRQQNGRSADKKQKKKARFNQTSPAMDSPEPHSSWKNGSSASLFVSPGDPFHSSSAHPARGQGRISLLERLVKAKAAEESSLKQRSKLTDDENDEDRLRRNHFSSRNPTTSIRTTRKPNSHDHDYDVSEDDDIVV